jgi:hypothetical protein
MGLAPIDSVTHRALLFGMPEATVNRTIFDSSTAPLSRF